MKFRLENEKIESRVTPLQCKCRIRFVIDQGDLTPKLRKTQKQIKKESKKEWLQEFREILVDDEIPVHKDSHASSSHEASLEPIFERREDLGEHSVYTHFPKDRHVIERVLLHCRHSNVGAGSMLLLDALVDTSNLRAPRPPPFAL